MKKIIVTGCFALGISIFALASLNSSYTYGSTPESTKVVFSHEKSLKKESVLSNVLFSTKKRAMGLLMLLL